MGFTEVLTIIFVVMKLLGVIGWSWWLVLLPEIIGFAFYIFLFLFVVTVNVKQEKQIRKTIRGMKGRN